MYKFKMPIGDWSGDGHGHCDWFVIESNKPVEEVREAHFKAPGLLGYDINQICRDYDEHSCYDTTYLENIQKSGFKFEDHCEDVERDWDDESKILGVGFNASSLAQLWVHTLMAADAELQLRLILEDEMPMLPFYGFDEKKRHISFVGYGVTSYD